MATYFTIRSKWCNWEIGLADSLKGTPNIAILSVASYKGNWNGNEYLDLYSELEVNSMELDLISVSDIMIKKLMVERRVLLIGLNRK